MKYSFPPIFSDSDPRPAQDAVFLNAWDDTLLMPVFALAIGSLLALILYALFKKSGVWLSPALLIPFIPYWLWQTEGWWFGLTCRRFAQIENGLLTLYGAFGRTRWQGRIADYRFYYRNGDRTHTPYMLSIEAADGRRRRFALNLCRDRENLMDALNAEDSAIAAQRHMQTFQESLPAEQRPSPIHAYILGVVALVGSLELITEFFLNIRLNKSAWLAGLFATAILTWPHLRLARRYQRHTREKGTPSQNRYARDNSALVVLILFAYSFFFTYNLAYISLIGKAYTPAPAQLSFAGTCSHRRASDTRKFFVTLPEPYHHFNEPWCSRVDDDTPFTPGVYTVYLRESALARQLRFSTPQFF